MTGNHICQRRRRGLSSACARATRARPIKLTCAATIAGLVGLLGSAIPCSAVQPVVPRAVRSQVTSEVAWGSADGCVQNIQMNDFGSRRPSVSEPTLGTFAALPAASASTDATGNHVWVGCVTSNTPLASVVAQGVANLRDGAGQVLPSADVSIGITNRPGGQAAAGCAITAGQAASDSCGLPDDSVTTRTLVGEVPAGTTELDWQYQLDLPASQPAGYYQGGEVFLTATAGEPPPPYGAVAWGSNTWANLGDGSSVAPESCYPTVSCARSPVGVAELTNPVALGAGEDFACAVISGGEVECWGRNDAGDLGTGSATGPENCPGPSWWREYECSRVPVRVSGITNATAVVAGVGFACALLVTHSIDCWGWGLDGELGNGHSERSVTPVQVSGITNAIAIAAGEAEACAVLSNHTVKCWGSNWGGDLGDGKTKEEQELSNVPVEVIGITSAVTVTAGDTEACAVLESGEVRCWGTNLSGDLGDDKTQNEQEFSDVPVNVSGITTATTLTAAWRHVCAVLKDGKVECWGDGLFGDLGDGQSGEPSPIPVAVSGISTATHIAAGYFHTCAVLSSGSVDCWGENSYGQLGDGKTAAEEEESSTPVAVKGLTGVTAIAAYEHTTVAYGPSLPIGKALTGP
jgi:alpha-tubulin suppressor-like RCC1 family protein